MTTTEAKSTKATHNRNEVTNETVLKIAKEITVKFIEVGRITPTSFESSFQNIYSTIESTVRDK
jgi:hypothetical protein